MPSETIPERVILILRSCTFTALMAISVVFFAGLVLATLGLPRLERWRFNIGDGCCRFELWLLEKICGLRYVLEGTAHLPRSGGILFWRHESAWETFLSFTLSARPTWVLKRELYWIPVIGWAIAALRPIAIDRGARRRAVNQILQKGPIQISQGRTLNFFPEGTRLAPCERRRYGLSGALLAKKLNCPVVPVAHNAGSFWRRRGWIKRPGVIQVRIGAPIDVNGRSPEAFNAAVQRWIEEALATMRVNA
ncbi:Phospholipid/glycerol acyltransferase [mine drainage metagenome]|uniref:Phospholipid/glycerol acyltransferase n=1 Tax=mine drainage metagenome TaxID=410659 RepID=T1C5U4_9ZZZZ